MTPDEISQLSDDEKNRRLQKLIPLEPYVDILVEEAKYKEARGTIVRKWHHIVIAGAALLVALSGIWATWQSFIKVSLPK